MAQTTMILADNSEDSINGDYPPSRWEAQIDAISHLLDKKYQSDNDNAAGLATMAGNAVEMLCVPTQDGNHVSSTLLDAKIGGNLHLVNAIQISIFALKSRANPRTKQRILLFIGSRISDTSEMLRVIGKKLNKDSIAVTILAFGDLSQQQKEKINTFHAAVNLEDNSQVHWVECGQNITDVLSNSSLLIGKNKPLKAEDHPDHKETNKGNHEQQQVTKTPEKGSDIHGQEQKLMRSTQIEVDKQDKNKLDLNDDQADKLARQLSLQEQARERELRANDRIEDEKDDQKDDKKKKEQDRETVASERLQASEVHKGQERTYDFITEKHSRFPKDSRTEKFKKELDEMAEEDEEEKKKEPKKEKDKKGHYTEKPGRKHEGSHK